MPVFSYNFYVPRCFMDFWALLLLLLTALFCDQREVWKRITEEVSAEWVFQAQSPKFNVSSSTFSCNRGLETAIYSPSCGLGTHRWTSAHHFCEALTISFDDRRKQKTVENDMGRKNINLVAVTKEKEERIINYWWYGLLFWWSPISRTFFPPIRNYVRSYKLLTANEEEIAALSRVYCKLVQEHLDSINNTVPKHRL